MSLDAVDGRRTEFTVGQVGRRGVLSGSIEAVAYHSTWVDRLRTAGKSKAVMLEVP